MNLCNYIFQNRQIELSDETIVDNQLLNDGMVRMRTWPLDRFFNLFSCVILGICQKGVNPSTWNPRKSEGKATYKKIDIIGRRRIACALIFRVTIFEGIDAWMSKIGKKRYVLYYYLYYITFLWVSVERSKQYILLLLVHNIAEDKL